MDQITVKQHDRHENTFPSCAGQSLRRKPRFRVETDRVDTEIIARFIAFCLTAKRRLFGLFERIEGATDASAKQRVAHKIQFFRYLITSILDASRTVA